MQKIVFLSISLLCFLLNARAQDTFAIVALDTATGEVGSAAATCVSLSPLALFINVIEPGVGTLNAQASVSTVNRDYGLDLMQRGFGTQEILDSLLIYDAAGLANERQYLIARFDSSGGVDRVAYSGVDCFDYKNHLIGSNYVIAGNILSDQTVLDSMEARFLAEEGTLADKLMAALQGANRVGADNRCFQYNTSSLSAYLVVSQADDPPGAPSLYLNVVSSASNPPVAEPIDLLQIAYDEWLVQHSTPIEAEYENLYPLRTWQTGETLFLEFELDKPQGVHIQLLAQDGRKLKDRVWLQTRQGKHQLSFEIEDVSKGMYYIWLNGSVKTIWLN